MDPITSTTQEDTRKLMRNIHQPTESENDPEVYVCKEWTCGMQWPCDTARVLNAWESDLQHLISELEELEEME